LIQIIYGIEVFGNLKPCFVLHGWNWIELNLNSCSVVDLLVMLLNYACLVVFRFVWIDLGVRV
jgi:hypothetical protein